MSQTNDGGPAFPSTDAKGFTSIGMSLRDWFAGQALDSDISYYRHQLYHAGGCIEDPTREECKYAYADAMLAERAKEGK